MKWRDGLSVWKILKKILKKLNWKNDFKLLAHFVLDICIIQTALICSRIHFRITLCKPCIETKSFTAMLHWAFFSNLLKSKLSLYFRILNKIWIKQFCLRMKATATLKSLLKLSKILWTSFIRRAKCFTEKRDNICELHCAKYASSSLTSLEYLDPGCVKLFLHLSVIVEMFE